MLKITNKGHYDEMVAIAKKSGSLDKLDAKLEYLKNYGDEVCCCELWPMMFGDIGFDFTMYRKDGSQWFNGGLVYDERMNTWGVHT